MATGAERARRVTITDIARRAGVSKGAVSYALNGQPGVSEATRQRIVAIAQEIGFNPNSAARALSDAGAITEAVRYLVALGHRRIARVSGLPGLLHTQTRTRAFNGICSSLGLEA